MNCRDRKTLSIGLCVGEGGWGRGVCESVGGSELQRLQDLVNRSVWGGGGMGAGCM